MVTVLDYEKFIIDLSYESNGIKKLFEILCPIIDILLKGKILVWDEIETSLHPNIVLQIIELFKYTRRKEFAQLIFSTHNTFLLDLNLFRRDQIWFTELKPSDRSTDLYSLSALKNVRKDENIRKGYISGKYGAIPMLNNNLANVLDEMNINND
jgi:AAA15 family ATPase/GTPase